MSRIKYCEQCERVMFAERSTKRYCSSRCRKRAQRDIEPLAWWLEDDNLSEDAQRVELLETIAANEPKAFEKLKTLKEYNGQRALDLALDAIRIITNET